MFTFNMCCPRGQLASKRTLVPSSFPLLHISEKFSLQFLQLPAAGSCYIAAKHKIFNTNTYSFET